MYLSESPFAFSSDKLNMPQLGGHVTTGGLSIEHVEEIFTISHAPWVHTLVSRLKALSWCLLRQNQSFRVPVCFRTHNGHHNGF